MRHDPKDPDNGGIVKLNSFLGIDRRGNKAYASLK